MSTANMLLRRLRMIVDRTLLLRVSYRGNQRFLQIASRKDVPLAGVRHMEPAGFSSHALPGAEPIPINPGGNSGRCFVIIMHDRRYSVLLEEGETIIYNMPHGDFVKIKADRSIHIKSALKVFVEAPLVEMSQDLLVRGAATVTGNITTHANLQVDGSMNIDGTSHSTGTFSTAGDVTAGSISLRGHHHQEHDGPNTVGGAI